jgi:23S rRNA (uracil1939-C5)-methyltransferase
MEFAFGRRRDDPWSGPQSIQVGLHQPGDFRHVLPIDECYLTPPSMESARLAARDSLRQLALQHPNSITIHDLKTHRGLLRHLVLRSSQASGAWLAAFITTSDPFPEVEQFAEALMKSAPHCAGLLWGISDGLSDVARPESIQKVWGNPILTERLGSLEFRLSPFSFFQTNTLGAEQLYDVVARFANLQGQERVLDAYCGTGTIGLYLAKAAKEIVGIELIEEAVEDARHNASMNGITNTQFWAGDMKEVLANHYAVTESPDFQPPFDLIVMDPPRGGMDKKALRHLLDLRPPRFIYVSCNPSTLARDAQDLLEKGYRPTQIQTVDLFPHTYHIESVVEFIHQS